MIKTVQKTEVKKVNESDIDMSVIHQAGRILKAGGLVAFPTETVYGLGADALDARASRKIYAAKGRPSDNPLIIHICSMEDMYKITADVPQSARRLAETFWPGPLTMILKKNHKVPFETTGGLETAAIRMPANKIALALIREGGGYIAAPSANTSGRPSPTLAEHVYDDMNGKIPLILDGGAVSIGIESTIVDLTEKTPVVLRPGYITLDMLAQVIGEVHMDTGLVDKNSRQKPKAPGMKYRHYAPKAEMIVINGKQQLVVAKIKELAKRNTKEGRKVGIIAAQETAEYYEQGVVLCIGERQDEETIAHNLYKILRTLDESDVDIILSESFSTPQMGDAIMNRLLKAAGYQVLEVT